MIQRVKANVDRKRSKRGGQREKHRCMHRKFQQNACINMEGIEKIADTDQQTWHLEEPRTPPNMVIAIKSFSAH